MTNQTDMEIQKNKSSQVLGSSCALSIESIPSEPPDLGNWFSSYVYESPALDTNLEFGNLFSIKTGNEGKGVDAEERNKQGDGDSRDEQENQFLEGPGSSLSLPSEPLDIGIWFSSYAYESPVLDTIDDFISPKESECRTKREKDEVVFDEKLSSNVFDGRAISDCNENHLPMKGVDGIEGDRESPSQIKFCLGKRTLQSHVGGLVKDTEKQNTCSGNIAKQDEAKSSPNADPVHLIANHQSQTRHQKSLKRSLDTRDLSDEDSKIKAGTELGTVLPTTQTDVASKEEILIGRSSRGSNAQKNAGQAYEENGFISTRKGRVTVEEGMNLLQGATLHGEEKAATTLVQREVLPETNNFQVLHKLETAGKWECPRKGKPDVGPPLKQLRLERWVHRV